MESADSEADMLKNSKAVSINLQVPKKIMPGNSDTFAIEFVKSKMPESKIMRIGNTSSSLSNSFVLYSPKR